MSSNENQTKIKRKSGQKIETLDNGYSLTVKACFPSNSVEITENLDIL